MEVTDDIFDNSQMEVDVKQQHIKNDTNNEVKDDDDNDDNDDDVVMDDTKNNDNDESKNKNKKTNTNNCQNSIVQVRRDSNGIIDFNYYKTLSSCSRKEQLPHIVSSIPTNPMTEFLTGTTYNDRQQYLQDLWKDRIQTNNEHDDNNNNNNNNNITKDEEADDDSSDDNDADIDDDDDDDDDDTTIINDEYISNFISIQYIQYKFIDNNFCGITWISLQKVGWKHIVETRQYRIPEQYIHTAILVHMPTLYYANDVLKLLDIPSIPSLYGSVHTITTTTIQNNNISNTNNTTNDQSTIFHNNENMNIEVSNISNEEIRKQKVLDIIRQLRYEVIHSMVTLHFRDVIETKENNQEEDVVEVEEEEEVEVEVEVEEEEQQQQQQQEEETTTTTTATTTITNGDGEKKKVKRRNSIFTNKKKKHVVKQADEEQQQQQQQQQQEQQNSVPERVDTTIMNTSIETSTDNKENDNNNKLSTTLSAAHESNKTLKSDDESEHDNDRNNNNNNDDNFKIEMLFNVNEIFDNDFSQTLVNDITNFIDNDIMKNDTTVTKVEEMEQEYTKYFNEWKMLLSTQHNILFYGVGSKRQLLDNFCSIELRKEGYILQLDGYDPTISISKILDLLVSLFLNNIEPSTLVSISSKNGNSRRKHNMNSNSPNNNNNNNNNNKSMIHMNTFLYHTNNYHTFHPDVQRAIGTSKDISRIASTRTHLPIFLCIHNLETLIHNSIEQYKSNYGITIALQSIGVLSYCSLYTNTTKNISSTSSSIRLFATIDNIPLYQSLIRSTDTITYNTIHWIKKHTPTCRPYNSKELQYCIKAVYEDNINYYINSNNNNNNKNNNNVKQRKSTIELWSGSTINDFKHFITVLRTLSPVRHDITKTLARLQLDAMNGIVSDDEDDNDKKIKKMNKKKKTSSSFDEFGNHIASPLVDEITTWIDFKKLLQVCLDKWTIRTSIDLRNLLGELIDQRIMFCKKIQVSSLSFSTGYNKNNFNNNGNNNETSSTVEYLTIPKNAVFLQKIIYWKSSV